MATATALPSPPLADPVPEAAFRSLLHTFGLLDRVMHPYFARFGISGAQWGVLRNLHRAEQQNMPALRVTELGRRLIIRPPSVTGIIDRLARDGLVKRESLPADRRVKLVSLTPRGRQRVLQVLSVHGAQIEKILAGLTPDEQADLHRLLERLRRHLESLAEPDKTEFRK